MKEPRLSVLMSVYKEPIEWLKQSVDSILQQTFKDFEFIIVCDNPSYTNGIDLLKSYSDKDKRIVLLFNGTNIGLTKSLNRGLAIARGDYIARMDADDISMPERLRIQVNYLEKHKEVSVVHSFIELFGEHLNSEIKTSPVANGAIIEKLMYSNCVHHPAVMFRKFVFDKFNIRYNESFRRSQDYDLWLQAALHDIVFATIPEVLLKYRISADQITRSHRSEQEEDQNRIKRSFFQNFCIKNGLQYPDEITRNYIHLFKCKDETSVNNRVMNNALRFQMYYSLPNTCQKFIQIIPDSIHLKFGIRQMLVLFLSFLLKNRWNGYDMNYLVNQKK